MARIVVSEFVSVDGVMEAAGGTRNLDDGTVILTYQPVRIQNS